MARIQSKSFSEVSRKITVFQLLTVFSYLLCKAHLTEPERNFNDCKTPSLLTTETFLRVAKDVRVNCLRKGKVINGLSVKWERPEGKSAVTGYQIYFVAEKPGVISNTEYCYQIGNEKREFIITRRNGLRNAKEISVMVVALPLPAYANIKLQKFQMCNENVAIRRRRESTDDHVLHSNISSTPALSTRNTAIDHITNRQNGETSNRCTPVTPRDNSSSYPGSLKIMAVKCRKKNINSPKKGIIVYWYTAPEDSNKIVKGFQVLYHTMRRGKYDINKQFCVQVGKNVHSVTLYKGIDEEVGVNVSIYIAVTALPTYGQLEIDMTPYLPCRVSDLTTSPSTISSTVEVNTTRHPMTTVGAGNGNDNRDKKGSPNIYGIVGGVSTGIILLLLLAAIHKWYKSRKQQPWLLPQSLAEEGCIYISYFPDTEKTTHSILNLVARLRKHDLNVKMDALCQREIDEVGKPIWYQSQLEAADKIILVLSKGYLKIYQEWKKGSTCKECTNYSNDPRKNETFFELGYISTDIFTGSFTGKLLIVLADVNESELPCFLKGRSTYPWPKSTMEEKKLVHAIFGTEEFATA